mmetsp:Transcript_15168/g.53245  ORF Transcript_15168/g.53245 Transcript_15168/m.53245 type:complete len:207 (+) Transcript_15168:1747-2367(+)
MHRLLLRVEHVHGANTMLQDVQQRHLFTLPEHDLFRQVEAQAHKGLQLPEQADRALAELGQETKIMHDNDPLSAAQFIQHVPRLRRVWVGIPVCNFRHCIIGARVDHALPDDARANRHNGAPFKRAPFWPDFHCRWRRQLKDSRVAAVAFLFVAFECQDRRQRRGVLQRRSELRAGELASVRLRHVIDPPRAPLRHGREVLYLCWR